MNALLKKPSAWIPIALSLMVIVLWLVFLTISAPPKPQPDEGTGAHLFQIWLVLEALLILVFALRWLPQQPKQAFLVLALQIAAVAAGCAPVAYFHL